MIWRTAVMLAGVVFAYALLRGWPDFLPPVMKACAAVLVLAAGLGIWAKRRPNEENRAKGRRRPRWLDYGVIGGGVLAIECGFLWLFGTAPQPLESVGLVIERTFRPEAAALRSIEHRSQQSRSGNWLWTRETRRPLPKRTDFKPGVKPEVFLRLKDPADVPTLLQGKIHVQAFALGRYEQASWAPTGGKPLEIHAEDDGFTRLAPQRKGRSIVHEVFHGADPGGQDVFTALAGASAAGISPLTRIGDGLHLLPPPAKVGGYQYLAASTPLRIEDLPDGGWIRPWLDAEASLLALPEEGDLGARIRSLARTAAGGGSLKEQLLRIQNHLKTQLDYSLATSNPRDLDPIENFLFEEKRGHCEYFATAGALMVRALGIPARVAYGWAGGKYYESAGLFVFRANEAHAWTEVRLENYGWVLMDPTPEEGGQAGRAQVAAPDESLPETLAAEDESDENGFAGHRVDYSGIALGLMVGFTIPVLGIGWWRGRSLRESLTDAPGTPASALPVPGYLRAWRDACRAQGIPIQPGFTLRRQLVRLPQTPEFAAELLSYHYSTRYEGCPTDKRREKALARRIRDWQQMIGNSGE